MLGGGGAGEQAMVLMTGSNGFDRAEPGSDLFKSSNLLELLYVMWYESEVKRLHYNTC